MARGERGAAGDSGRWRVTLSRLLRAALVVGIAAVLQELEGQVAAIPKRSCCGKPVVFAGSRKRWKCGRCGARWRLVVDVQPDGGTTP